MHGNVLEWCSDWYGEYPRQATIDPQGPDAGDQRVLRGGSWVFHGRYVRSAYRDGAPGDASRSIGFRFALDLAL